MQLFEVTVRAPGIEKAFEQKIKVYAYSPWQAAVNVYAYAIEANVCEPQISEVNLVTEEKIDATETIIPFSR